MNYDNGSEFKLHFCALCKTDGVKRKPTRIKSITAKSVLAGEKLVAMYSIST
jgi:hypothetical protein